MNPRARIYLGVAALLAMLSLLAGCSDPQPSPTTPPTIQVETVQIYADGTGDYATLSEAIAAVSPGAIIRLAAGTYQLATPLTVNKPVQLIGAGMNETEIVSAAAPHVVRFEADGLFVAEDLTFRHHGQLWADTVLVTRGQVAIARCRFAGARGSQLVIRGATVGTVADSVAESGGGGVGFSIQETARPTLVNNTSSHNSYGIRVRQQAEPVLERNLCLDNQMDGIKYDGQSAGIARGNDCAGNRSGIVVSESARPTLEDNRLKDNFESCIGYFDLAAGSALRNECTRNFGGIGVADRAAPTLEDNILDANLTAGIAYFTEAGGVARNNSCSGNGIHGISVFGQATPILEDNNCSGNGEVGIHYADAAAGSARNNACSRNKVGIAVASTANPDLGRNDCRDNTDQDIRDLRP
jgi:parallel beta-helix repeat protein